VIVLWWHWLLLGLLLLVVEVLSAGGGPFVEQEADGTSVVIRYTLAGDATLDGAVNFADLGCDYYSLCGHKWLMGPKGTAALLIRKELLDGTPVSFTGAHSHESFDDQGNEFGIVLDEKDAHQCAFAMSERCNAF